MPSHDSSQAALEANHVFIPCIVVWTLGLPLVWGGWVGWMGAGPCQGLANKSHRRLHTCGSKKHLMPSSIKSPLPKDSDFHTMQFKTRGSSRWNLIFPVSALAAQQPMPCIVCCAVFVPCFEQWLLLCWWQKPLLLTEMHQHLFASSQARLCADVFVDLCWNMQSPQNILKT